MLYNLEILNGEITPQFSSEVFNYEVNVDSSALTLIFNYDTCDTCNVTVYGNNFLTEGENHVLIEVYDKELITYTLIVNKEKKSESVFSETNDKVEIKVNNNKEIFTPLIGVICFLSILTLFYVIFHKKKV